MHACIGYVCPKYFITRIVPLSKSCSNWSGWLPNCKRKEISAREWSGCFPLRSQLSPSMAIASDILTLCPHSSIATIPQNITL